MGSDRRGGARGEVRVSVCVCVCVPQSTKSNQSINHLEGSREDAGQEVGGGDGRHAVEVIVPACVLLFFFGGGEIMQRVGEQRVAESVGGLAVYAFVSISQYSTRQRQGKQAQARVPMGRAGTRGESRKVKTALAPSLATARSSARSNGRCCSWDTTCAGVRWDGMGGEVG